MKVVAVVHAKGESKRLPNKNMRLLGGVPLVSHAISNAVKSKATSVAVDSDSDEILNVGSHFGRIQLIKRPPYLANNETTGDDLAYWQAQNFSDYDIIVQVVPTSPFTKPETINKCIEYVQMSCNSAFTVTSEDLYTWGSHVEDGEFLPDYYNRMGKLMNSNELIPTLVEHTGVYAFKTKFAFKQRRRIDVASFRTVPISHIEKIDINTEEDFQFAEVVWKGLNLSSP